MCRHHMPPTPLLLSVCFVFFLMSHGYPVNAQSVQQIAKKAFMSTVLLVMEDANGRPTSLGSGFFVLQEVVATNLHVVEGASSGYVKAVGQKPKNNIEGIVGVDTERDLVLLKVSGAHGVPLSLGNSDGIEVGETVYAMGNPQGLEGTFSQGIVSSIREVGTDKLLQITAPISPGSSGGPVLNAKGEAIGVSVATFKGGQNLNFAIPSNYLKRLLANSRAPTALAGLRTVRGRNSILGDSGGRNTEGVVVENLTYDSSQPMGYFSFSLVNKMREPVRNITGLIVFHDLQGNPLDVAIFTHKEAIPGGLAKRVKGKVDESVEKLNNPTRPFPFVPDPPRRPQGGKIEARVLDFQIGD
jgi:S1-C subfamily serine protease